ncbi:hypothetical protein H6P81_012878 [Aristolochia fimbriata]|uniref:Expansin n=1 Tax=Aristolochia fimbriata TaxID=158543 RepID=A0AAV7ED38_ARIFI|nr:hypothetical protein H6P81_012878 [Aristolochia fimbriata]
MQPFTGTSPGKAPQRYSINVRIYVCVSWHGTPHAGGACGYENLFDRGYGLENTALSEPFYKNGLACGSCYEVKCNNDPRWCLPGRSVKVTVTNFCPDTRHITKPFYYHNNMIINSRIGLNSPYLSHFDLSMPMFMKIADITAGLIPVLYRRIPCSKVGGVKFELKGNPWFLTVLVYNVAGAGDVVGVSVKGGNTGWMSMNRNWGQVWDVHAQLGGQSLSFRVSTGDGRTVEAYDVAPSNWQVGQNYEAHVQF